MVKILSWLKKKKGIQLHGVYRVGVYMTGRRKAQTSFFGAKCLHLNTCKAVVQPREPSGL